MSIHVNIFRIVQFRRTLAATIEAFKIIDKRSRSVNTRNSCLNLM